MPTNIPEFPSAENRLWPWCDLDGNWWKWMGGYWARLHPMQPGELARHIYTGTVEDLRSFDGGDGTDDTPTDFTGPMWEVAADMSALFPVGVGAFPNAGQVDVNRKQTSLNIQGAESVSLIKSQLPSHSHDIAIQVPGYGGQDGERDSYDGGTDSNPITNDTEAYPSADLNSKVKAEADDVGELQADPHNNLPPMVGVYFIQRTARRYYTSPYYDPQPCQCAPTSEVLTGTGSPEGVVTADEGAVYTDTAADTIYIKSSGSGNTGWVLA